MNRASISIRSARRRKRQGAAKCGSRGSVPPAPNPDLPAIELSALPEPAVISCRVTRRPFQSGSGQLLDGGGESMPDLVPALGPFARHPVHLKRAARPFKGMMTVPGIVRAQEDQKRTVVGWNFSDIVINVRAVAQNTQAPALLIPLLVQIQQDCNDLVLGIRV